MVKPSLEKARVFFVVFFHSFKQEPFSLIFCNTLHIYIYILYKIIIIIKLLYYVYLYKTYKKLSKRIVKLLYMDFVISHSNNNNYNKRMWIKKS